MKKIFLILSFAICLSISSWGQTGNTASKKQVDSISNKLLIGKWHSEGDDKYMLVFQKKRVIELYAKDTTDNLYYKLSGSCKLKDSSAKMNLQKAYLLFYSKEDSVRDCNEVLNLRSNVLSWMNNANGRISVFKKMK
jgi:hypothetical protein